MGFLKGTRRLVDRNVILNCWSSLIDTRLAFFLIVDRGILRGAICTRSQIKIFRLGITKVNCWDCWK